MLKNTLFLLGSVLILAGFAQSAMAMNSNIVMTQPILVDTSGQKVSSFHTGQQIGIESTLTNNGKSDQKITYLVQILDSKGNTNFLEGSSLLGNGLPSNQTITASRVWTPTSTGQYTVEIFVWSSLTSAIPLTDVLHTQITVT